MESSHITRSQLRQTPDGGRTWTEAIKSPEGTFFRKVSATPWELKRTNCFCCTCQDRDWGRYLDPFCREHGFGFGTRPCEEHNMAGKPYTEEMIRAGEMPHSVQVIHKRQNREASDES